MIQLEEIAAALISGPCAMRGMAATVEVCGQQAQTKPFTLAFCRLFSLSQGEATNEKYKGNETRSREETIELKSLAGLLERAGRERT